MQLIFYKTDDLFAMLIMVLVKGCKQGLTFNVFFQTDEECQAFSRAMWNSSSSLPHGLCVDNFYSMQPILITTDDIFSNFSDAMKKDCALIVAHDSFEKLKQTIHNWQKVCFVNASHKVIDEYKNIPHAIWEYKNKVWVEAK